MRRIKRGDICVFDPLNKLKQTSDGTIHALVLETGFRKIKILSMETFDIMTCPKKYLFPVNFDDIAKVQITYRDETFVPKFEMEEIQLVNEVAKLISEHHDLDANGMLVDKLMRLSQKMQADRIDNNIKVDANLYQRTSAAVYNVEHLLDTRTFKDWCDIDSTVIQFMTSVADNTAKKLLADWAQIPDNNKVLSMGKEIDEYLEGMDASDASIIVKCMESVFGCELNEIGSDKIDLLATALVHVLIKSNPEDMESILNDLYDELDDKLELSKLNFIWNAVESYFGSNNPLLGNGHG